MGDIALVNGDIAVSEFNDVNVLYSEDDDIIQQAINNIMTVLGEMELHPEIGNDIHNMRVKITGDMGDIIAECETAIGQDPRIDQIVEVTAEDIGSGSVDIGFTIVTIYDSTLSSSTTINII